MSELLYYETPYERSFTATVTEAEPAAQGWAVQLDRTLFYPEGGGQPSDIGWIDNIEVTRVEKQGSQLWHYLVDKPEHNHVRGLIKWSHRFDYMQQHTGQHILSAVMYRRFGYNTVAVHQGDEYTTIEIDRDSIGSDEISEIENAAIELINQNLPLRTKWVKDSEVEEYDLRRDPKVSGDIRLVLLDSYDVVACGGIHTGSTGEVKLVKHVNTEKIRGRVRLYWKIGERAIEDYDRKNKIVQTLGDWFSAQAPELLERVEGSLDELNEQRKRANYMESRVAGLTAQQLLSEARPGTGGMPIITAEFNGEGKDFLKKVVQELPDDTPWAACLINHQEQSFQWLIAVSEQLEFDLNPHRKQLLALIDGKGGGRTPVWQGIGSTPEGLPQFFAQFSRLLDQQATH
jgi:alanyl-tRNA synthetase